MRRLISGSLLGARYFVSFAVCWRILCHINQNQNLGYIIMSHVDFDVLGTVCGKVEFV